VKTSVLTDHEPDEVKAMFDTNSTAQSFSDVIFVDHIGISEFEIPEALDQWSEKDFDDVVPAWRAL